MALRDRCRCATAVAGHHIPSPEERGFPSFALVEGAFKQCDAPALPRKTHRCLPARTLRPEPILRLFARCCLEQQLSEVVVREEQPSLPAQ